MNGDIAPLTYQRIGNLGKVSATLVEPAIQECVKSVTAKFTAEELVTKREVVKLQIQQSLIAYINNTLKEKSVENAISIANLAITDFNFSPEFNRAIESKVQAEQQALQAKNEKLKRVTQAEAAAAERQLSADAEACSTEVQSKARAKLSRSRDGKNFPRFRKGDPYQGPVIIVSCGRLAVRLSCTRRRAAKDLSGANRQGELPAFVGHR
jgi:regulator of protease activity HflC (stomatin/prohibitin superfamily)